MSAPFETTAEQVVQLAKIVTAMDDGGLPRAFIAKADELARVSQGAFELMELWSEAENPSERDEILADIEELIEEAEDAPPAPQKRPYVPFNELDRVSAQVMEHKKKLRELIDKHGGVTAVAERAGMPQPSLSRMLASASMPRRTTLYRIANALGVPESQIVGEWLR